jgi:membrane protease YdiL (CAAX protease family)
MYSREWPLLRTGLALLSAFFLGAGGLLIGFVLMFVVILLLVAVVGLELTATMQIVVALVFVQGVGCAGVAGAYVAFRPYIAAPFRKLLDVTDPLPRFRPSVSIPDLKDLAVVGVGYVTAIAVAILGSVVVSSLQVDTGQNSAAEMAMEAPEILLLLIPASILIIGPGEEALFRGVVQGRIREVLSPVPGVIVPSVIFAGLHWFALSGGSPEGNLIALGVLVGPALVFGASYEYTGNLVVPALIHGIYNATLFTLLYVSLKFGDQLPDSAMITALSVP